MIQQLMCSTWLTIPESSASIALVAEVYARPIGKLVNPPDLGSGAQALWVRIPVGLA